MGVKDIITKDYMKECNVFADAFNQYIYKGKQVIKAENLRPLDAAIAGVPYGADGAGVPVQRFRDVLKSATAMEDEDTVYLLLAVEAQSEVHHAMPVRNMVYDALQYAAQVEEAARSHRQARRAKEPAELAKKPDAGEYLSGFYRGDRLIPVITLVLYFGPGEWDGPMSIHEMLSVQNPEILSFVSDYKLNLIAPASMTDEELDRFTTSLREVMLFIKYSKDKKKLREMVQKDERFRTVDKKAAAVISTVTGTEIEIEEEEEVVDMCEGMRGIIEDATNAGIEQGMEQGRFSTYVDLVKKGLISVCVAAAQLDMTEDELKACM